MTFDEFILKNKRKNFDALVDDYLEEVFGIAPLDIDLPKNYFIRFEHYSQLTDNFNRIMNTPGFTVKKGDLCVWGSGVCDGRGYASVAAKDGDSKHFYTCERSHRGKRIKRVRHNYKYFLGVLRAKTTENKANSKNNG